MIRGSICKKCRRAGQKLFLREERCLSPKCAMIKKPYVPGMKAKKHRSALSEYGSQLAEKQKLKRIYGLTERQFRKYFEEAAKAKGVVADALIKKLETRLDNVVFRLGWGGSRAKTRQIVSHGHISLNGSRVDIPSINVKKGDVVEIRQGSLKKVLFKDLDAKMKKQTIPSWLSVEGKENGIFKITISGTPIRSEVLLPVDLAMIVEFYSR
ncbi:MAG: 30S ribosomal protein S4 [Candidatus Portnoybacteria bacterium]|nr:30S ribosomal protein S4 [Candidatus Portnoybacteria bacterium]